MNKYQLSEAYAKVIKEFNLRADQRDGLDRSNDYLHIMEAAHENDMYRVEQLLIKNNYFNADDEPKFELVG